ncbi:MAG: hypothetical protein ACOZHQ_10110 [Thermodesulfobacteriota bacterium]
MSAPHRVLLAPMLVCAALMIGCTAARMEVAPPLRASTVEMPVTGREVMGLDRAIAFGPYRTVGVQRSWTSTSVLGAAWGNVDYSQLQAGQRYQFNLVSPGAAPLMCQCSVGASQQWLDVFMGRGGELNLRLAGQDSLACALAPADGGPPWRLVLGRGGSAAVFTGVLTSQQKAFELRGSQRLAGTSIPLGEATGYEFLHAGRPVAAVEVLNDGAVFLPPGPPDDDSRALAAAAAAILLHMEIGRR